MIKIDMEKSRAPRHRSHLLLDARQQEQAVYTPGLSAASLFESSVKDVPGKPSPKA
jgi:hypothetical protein